MKYLGKTMIGKFLNFRCKTLSPGPYHPPDYSKYTISVPENYHFAKEPLI